MSEMTDIELIDYCEIHCTTERALFAGKHINRMIELAGNPADFPKFVRHDALLSAHEEMAELCKLARARLVSPVAAEQAAPELPTDPVIEEWALMHMEPDDLRDEVRKLRAAARLGTADLPYRVYEFWSSANPGKKVLMLAEGRDIADWAKRGDFIRDVTGLAPDAPAQPQPLNQAEPVEGASAWPAEPASQPDAIVAARALLESKWDAEGECGSCGWHAALYEHRVDDDDIADALKNNGGVLELLCVNKDDEDPASHRGVKINISPEAVEPSNMPGAARQGGDTKHSEVSTPTTSGGDTERAAFEKAMNDARFFPRELDFSRAPSPSGRDEYVNSHLQSCWVGWQARARLAPLAAPTDGARDRHDSTGSIRPSAEPAGQRKVDAWWLGAVDDYGTAWAKDGPHDDRAGVAKAKYLFDSMGLTEGRKLVCMAVEVSEIEGSASGVNMDALGACQAMGLRPEAADQTRSASEDADAPTTSPVAGVKSSPLGEA